MFAWVTGARDMSLGVEEWFAVNLDSLASEAGPNPLPRIKSGCSGSWWQLKMTRWSSNLSCPPSEMGGKGSRATGELKMEAVTGATLCAQLLEAYSQKTERQEVGSLPPQPCWLCKVTVTLPWFPVCCAPCCPASTNAQWLWSWGAVLQFSTADCSQI